MSNELIPVDLDQVTPAALFVDGGLPELLERIETEARALVPDTETDAGRKAIASNAYRVARSKTYLDNIGKEFVSDLKAQTKAVDEQRKTLRERMDSLRDKVRRPLTEIEEAEKAHEAVIRGRIDAMLEPWTGTVEEISARLAEIEATVIDISFSKLINEAAQAKDAAITRGRAAWAEAEAAEEAERQRVAEEAKARKEREKQIAKEAAERAKKMAEQKAAAAAKAEAERVERERREAERKAREEIERAEAYGRKTKEAAERRQKEAEQRALTAELALVQADQRRIAQEKAKAVENLRLDAERKARAARVAEREAETISALGDLPHVGDDGACEVLSAVQDGRIPNLRFD